MYQSYQAMAKVNAGDVEAGRQQLIDLAKLSPRDVSAWYVLAQVDAGPATRPVLKRRLARLPRSNPNDARGAIALRQCEERAGDHQGAVAALDPRVTAATDKDISAVSTAAWSRTSRPSSRRPAIGAARSASSRPPASGTLTTRIPCSRWPRPTSATSASPTPRKSAVTSSRRIRPTPPRSTTSATCWPTAARKLPEAVDLVKRALAIESDNPSYLDSLGWAYFKSSQFDTARDPLEHAAAPCRRTPSSRRHLAEVYFQLKRYREAATAWDKALAGDRAGIDAADITRKRDKARELAGK